jgi:hypothetical protein
VSDDTISFYGVYVVRLVQKNTERRLHLYSVGFEVFTAVVMRSTIFWDIGRVVR